LRRAGAGVIFEEKASGTKRDGRSELQKVLSVLGEGDALVVTRLDRLGRSLRDIANITHEIEQSGAHLNVLEQGVDTSSAANRAFFGMSATFAAFETDIRRERQLEGIALAKRSGVYKGGKPRLDRERVKELSDDGIGPAAIARQLRMARSSVYERHWEFCGSTSYGRGCSYSPSRTHRHGGGGRCRWCGSSSMGRGCSYSPTGAHER
jgi:DNA invertase Pin-like site-specific DNA recombinase